MPHPALTEDECLLILVLVTKALTDIAGDPAMADTELELESIIQKLRPDSALRALAAYIDPTKPPRACDKCGREYRGPAVYCSLTCAMADA